MEYLIQVIVIPHSTDVDIDLTNYAPFNNKFNKKIRFAASPLFLAQLQALVVDQIIDPKLKMLLHHHACILSVSIYFRLLGCVHFITKVSKKFVFIIKYHCIFQHSCKY